MDASPERGSRSKRPWSVAFRAALALFAFLVAVVAVVLVVVQRDAQHVALAHSLGVWRIALVSALVIAIPIATYFVVRLWMNEDRTGFRDLQSAWDAGLAELSAAGIELDATPVFLLLGFDGERAARSFFAASGIDFLVNGAPDRAAPLYWFGHREGVFLCCTEAGGLSAFSALVERAAEEFEGDGSSYVGTPGVGRATMALSDADEESATPFRPVPEPARARTQTIDLDSYVETEAPTNTVRMQAVRVASGSRIGSRRTVSLPAQDEIVQSRRLRDLCRLLRAKRTPLCPVNGLVVVLPMDDIMGESGELEQVQRLVRGDVATVQQTLELRAPTTVVVSNCDRGAGFRELMRRVGRERCSKHRFGHRFDVRCPATYESLSDFAEQLSGVFEDWVYSLFRQTDVLTRPGNTRLHGLLSRVRSVMKARLATVLAGGLGDEREKQAGDAGVLFSGCYFCATGAQDDRQAFVKGVVDKLEAEQEEVEWTSAAERLDGRHRLWTTIGFVLTGLLALSAVALVVLAPR